MAVSKIQSAGQKNAAKAARAEMRSASAKKNEAKQEAALKSHASMPSSATKPPVKHIEQPQPNTQHSDNFKSGGEKIAQKTPLAAADGMPKKFETASHTAKGVTMKFGQLSFPQAPRNSTPSRTSSLVRPSISAQRFTARAVKGLRADLFQRIKNGVKATRLTSLRTRIKTHVMRPLVYSARCASRPVRVRRHGIRVRTPEVHAKISGRIRGVSAGSRTTTNIIYTKHQGPAVVHYRSPLDTTGRQSAAHRGNRNTPAGVMIAREWSPSVMLYATARPQNIHPYPSPMALDVPMADILAQYDPDIEKYLFELADRVDPGVREELLSCIIEQLQAGPKSLAEDDLRKRFNTLIPSDIAQVDQNTWKALLQETLLNAIYSVRVFDGIGMRGREAVLDDGALLLDLELEQFIEWEHCFNMDGIDVILSNDESISLHYVSEPYEIVVAAIQKQLAERAHAAFASGEDHGMLVHARETEIQWIAARVSSIKDTHERINITSLNIAKLFRRNRIEGACVLTLIVQYSELSRRRASASAPAARWSRDEILSLISRFIEGAPSILSDRNFRSQLTTWENDAFNQLVYRANYSTTMHELQKLDANQPIDVFFDLLSESGREDEVLHDIWEDMARNFAKLN